MAPKRPLPAQVNPMVAPAHLPPLEILVERRRLGQTNLAVKAGQSGITNATRPENLGKFDYAHLRVPLPPNLAGSGVFSLQRGLSYPESYFLMRRSSDGYISATGMFKAAFPWASAEEEDAERQYHKKMPAAGPVEIAGNVWVAPESALKLANDYGLKPYIVALLDPSPIEKGSTNTSITSPPRFVVPEKEIAAAQPSQPVGSVRKRTLRSASPSKIATPSRKIASPRKPRTARKAKADNTTPAAEASSRLNSALENGASAVSPSVDDSVEGHDTPLVNGTGKRANATAKKAGTNADDAVTVKVDEEIVRQGNTETTTTHVKVEMPPGVVDLPLPESPEAMVAKAKEMVEEANRLEESRSASSMGKISKAHKKRKAEEVEQDEDSADGANAGGRGKRVKVLEEEIKRGKVRTRAMVGITATLAIGAIIPYLF